VLRATVLALSLGASLILLAGCGAETERAAAPRPAGATAASDRAAIQARVAAYVRHTLTGDGAQACAQFTPAYRRSMDQRAADGGLGDCAEVLSTYGEIVSTDLPEDFVREAATPDRVIVLLEGDRAQASVKTPSGGLSAKRTSLRRVGSRWLIDELGVSRTG
jgi:hypothetical protein